MYVVIGLVVLVLAAAAYVLYTNMDTTGDTDTMGAGEQVDGELTDEDFGTQDLDGDGLLSAEEIEAQSETRANTIQSERERLLAEQASLQAQSSASTTDANTAASAQRQQEIEIELLELQNAEEYPPLPDPGA